MSSTWCFPAFKSLENRLVDLLATIATAQFCVFLTLSPSSSWLMNSHFRKQQFLFALDQLGFRLLTFSLCMNARARAPDLFSSLYFISFTFSHSLPFNLRSIRFRFLFWFCAFHSLVFSAFHVCVRVFAPLIFVLFVCRISS